MKKLIAVLTWPWREYKQRKAIKKRIKELKDKDPFIYE